MASIFYHIIAYKEPEVVARLVNRVQTKSDFVRIHLDTMIGKKRFSEWKKIIEEKCQKGNVEIISEVRCKYGSFGMVDATLSAMRSYDDYNYDYFIELTGDSYSLKTPEVIKKELNEKNCAMIEFFELPYKGWYQGGLHRLSNRFYFMPRRKYPFVWTIRFPRLNKELPCGFKPYGGRGNLCLQKRHVSYILEFVEKNPLVKEFFKRVWGPNEMFYQTILLNSPLRSSVVNESTMYFDYSKGEPHPRILTKSDLEALKRSGKFFARKFNLNIDRDILDIIDQELKKVPNRMDA
jgi:hypothetical protein